jgi:hypothetical protein
VESGAPGFDHYRVGYPVDPEKLELCVRFADGREAHDESLTVNLHLQLPGIEEEGAYKYIDAVNEYLHGVFSPQEAGFTDCGFSIAMTDNFRAGTIEVFYEITLSETLDDCD